MRNIILASQSPRRKELLTQMGVLFEAIPSNFAEKLDDSRAPEEVAQELALSKALAVSEQYSDSIVIGSDTIVTIGGRQLEKPKDSEDAIAMLKLLSGKTHNVTTGLAVVRKSDNIQLVGSDTTKVRFRPYDEAAIVSYVASGDPLDKAGGYGIQSGAAPLVDYIAGRYDTVIGLPVELLAGLLTKLGVESRPVKLVCPVEQR